MSNKIVFNRQTSGFILESLGYSVDPEGFIINSKTKDRILATDGRTIKSEEFGGVTKDGIFRNDLLSLIEISDRLK